MENKERYCYIHRDIESDMFDCDDFIEYDVCPYFVYEEDDKEQNDKN